MPILIITNMTIGSHDFINKAKRMRKALGGGMRQSGVLAAAGLVALDDFEAGMLSHDHKRAQQLADAINGISYYYFYPSYYYYKI